MRGSWVTRGKIRLIKKKILSSFLEKNFLDLAHKKFTI